MSAFDANIPHAFLGVVPEEIEVRERFDGWIDSVTGRRVDFRKVEDNGRGVWYFVDTGEVSEDIRASGEDNTLLFDLLATYEKMP